MIHIRLMIVLLLSSVFVSGCWNAREIENMIYINALGVDYVNNQVVVYAQILNFTNIAKMEAGGQQGQETVAISKSTGDNFLSAAFQLYPTAQQRVTWSHIRSLVFTERALKQGLIKQVLDEFDRYYEFRYTPWTYSTQESLDDLFNAKPLFHISVLYSQLTDPQDIYTQNSVIPSLRLNRFISYRNESNRTVYLPTLALDKTSWSQGTKPSPKLRSNGACILCNQALLSCWPREELLGLRWLLPETHRTLLGVKKNQQMLANTVVSKPHVTITPILRGSRPSFKVHVSVSGFITQSFTPVPVETLEQEAAKKIAADIKGLFKKGLKKKIDTLQLGHTFYRKYPQEWKRLSVNDALPIFPESLESVTVKLENGGLAKVKQQKKKER